MIYEVASAVPSGHEPDLSHMMVQFALQLAVIIIATRLGGALFKHIFRLPRVLGELSSGMLIGPFALGALPLPLLGPLFPVAGGALPVSSELYAIATLASIVLLFLAGLETDLAAFIRYSVAGTFVGFCGVFFSFVLGDLCALWFGIADSFMDPRALFLGTISTATSVGITARILTEEKKTDSPEGVTTMAGAVFDDVLGIIILAMVVGLSRLAPGSTEIDWAAIGIIAGKALGFWLGCTAVGILLAKPISRMLKLSRTPSTIAATALGLALLLAGLSEMAGLAMIIGAYITGLSLSRTDLVDFLQDHLHGLYDFLVPIFFCVMGMLVDFGAMRNAAVFGLVFSLVAVLAKVIGCALPAYLTGFNLRGGLRIGLGMMPRGEVALIVAGVGLSAGIIQADLFGVSIMMTMLTTLLAPPLLIQALKGGSGLRGERGAESGVSAEPVTLEFPSPDIAEFLLARILRAFRGEDFFIHRIDPGIPSFQIRKEDMSFSLHQNGPEIILMATADQQLVARLIILEELLSLEDLLESARKLGSVGAMGSELVKGMFEE